MQFFMRGQFAEQTQEVFRSLPHLDAEDPALLLARLSRSSDIEAKENQP